MSIAEPPLDHLFEGRIRPYTAARIRQSYDRAEKTLARCEGLGTRRAYDAGCGAGFDSFALKSRFDEVIAVDIDGSAIREARRIARALGTGGLTFRKADACRDLARDCDLVWCNLMSHNVGARVELVTNLAGCLADGGWLVYSEETEGYALREIDTAVRTRSAPALLARLRQVANGLLGRPAFRFFLAGSAAAELAPLGLRAVHEDHEAWHGLPVVHRTYARMDGVARPPNTRPRHDGADYTQVPSALAWARHEAQSHLADRPETGFRESQWESLRRIAASAQNPLAPLLIVLLMADLVPGALEPRTARWERLRNRVYARHEPLDWTVLSDLNDELIDILRA